MRDELASASWTTDDGVVNEARIREVRNGQGSRPTARARVWSACLAYSGIQQTISRAIGSAKLIILAHMGGGWVGKIIVQSTDGNMLQPRSVLRRSVREES